MLVLDGVLTMYKIVRSQEELDDALSKKIWKEIYVCFGSIENPAIIDDRFGHKIVVSDSNFCVVKNSSVVIALDECHVESRGNSFVIARNKSKVDAYDDSRIINKSFGQMVINDKAKIRIKFEDVYDFMDFFNIEHDETKAIFYIATRKIGKKYIFNMRIACKIGKIQKSKCDPDIQKVFSFGIGISNKEFAKRFDLWENKDILEVETDIKDIIVPIKSDGIVRTSKIKVLREVLCNG